MTAEAGAQGNVNQDINIHSQPFQPTVDIHETDAVTHGVENDMQEKDAVTDGVENGPNTAGTSADNDEPDVVTKTHDSAI